MRAYTPKTCTAPDCMNPVNMRMGYKLCQGCFEAQCSEAHQPTRQTFTDILEEYLELRDRFKYPNQEVRDRKELLRVRMNYMIDK